MSIITLPYLPINKEFKSKNGNFIITITFGYYELWNCDYSKSIKIADDINDFRKEIGEMISIGGYSIVGKYRVYVQKEVFEVYEVIADTKEEAEQIYSSKGMRIDEGSSGSVISENVVQLDNI